MTRSEKELRAVYREPLDPAALGRLRATIGELGMPAVRSRRSRWLAPAAVAAVVVAVFAAIAGYGLGGGRGGAGGVLRLWADFPVNASPRPLVLTGPAIIDPASGFPADGAAKLAYVYGSFELATTLPTGPATVNGQQVSTAAQALAELRDQGDGKKPALKPLPITGVEFGSGTFSTDRGQRTLPAWTFHFAGVSDPARVLAVPPFDRWPLPGMPMGDGSEGGATISADGNQVTVSFIGPEPGNGPCGAEYSAEVEQSSTAVSISVRELPNPNADQASCSLVGYIRTVTVTLQSPLGNRVVIDAHGIPLPVG